MRSNKLKWKEKKDIKQIKMKEKKGNKANQNERGKMK